jgi:hypothetical protein
VGRRHRSLLSYFRLMTNYILALAIGMAIGWAICHAWIQARLGRFSAWASKQALSPQRFESELRKSDALLEAAEADTDLELLAALDNGQVCDVKKVLVHKLGLFYHRWAGKPAGDTPESIQKSLAAIRNAANDYESVQAVITDPPEDVAPAA